MAIQDNVDTKNRDNGTMEMMPIMNVFNEWHAANTSKKIRAVKRGNAKERIYPAKKGFILQRKQLTDIKSERIRRNALPSLMKRRRLL